MTEVVPTLHELLKKQLKRSDFELVGVVAMPTSTKKIIQIKALHENLAGHESAQMGATIDCLVQLRVKQNAALSLPVGKERSMTRAYLDGIYLPNGRLNVPYLIKNAEILADAGDYSAARKIYKTILQTGDYKAGILVRMGKCYEAEGKLAEAALRYEESIGYHPTAETYHRLANILFKLKKDTQADEILEKARSLKVR